LSAGAVAGALEAALAQLVPPLAFAGVAVGWPDGRETAVTRAAPGIVADGQSLFRAASLSKIVTGRVFRAAAEGRGLSPPYAVEASDLLGWRLRHPRWPKVPVTAGMVAAHAAGLSDAGGYLVPRGEGLRDWLARPECWGEAAPGTVFDYANLGYVLIAAMAERMAGARFDRLARRELARIGVEGGFNWSGVPPAARARRLPTFRRAGGRFLPQIDGQVSARGLSGPEGRALRLRGWQAGEAPGVFSPQGGLRISLSGALRLARSLSEADGPVLWSGPTSDQQVFQSYGLGVQFLDAPAFWPRPVMGHFGNAYGFAGGLWKDRVTGVAIVVALNGLPEGDENDRLREEELALYGALAHACG